MTFPFKGLITLCRLKLTGYLKDCVLTFNVKESMTKLKAQF